MAQSLREIRPVQVPLSSRGHLRELPRDAEVADPRNVARSRRTWAMAAAMSPGVAGYPYGVRPGSAATS
ncbi:MAG: hypothetical protein ACR2KG_07120 [Nocardioidaceae bacterium]